jgi:ABC-type polysaccharide/polyol phosphate export permease
MVISAIKGLINWNELIMAFAVTNLKQRYKQRYLRSAWAVLNPLLMMAIFTVVFSASQNCRPKASRIRFFVLPH